LLCSLQLLASKLGLAASSLFIGCADSVIAYALWFSLDQLEQFTEFVERIVQPETFIAVVKVGHGASVVRTGCRAAHCPL